MRSSAALRRPPTSGPSRESGRVAPWGAWRSPPRTLRTSSRPGRGGRAPRRGDRLRSPPRGRASRPPPHEGAPRAEGAPRSRGGARMIEELTRACVHCGFCLPTCPTYVLWSEEMDSPRGRIQLMEKTAQGTLTLSPTVTEHFDRCLGCMACVTSCPSGVQYDRLIEETRAHGREPVRRPRRERLSVGCCSRRCPTPDACAGRCGWHRSAGGCPHRRGRVQCSSSRRAGARPSSRRRSPLC